MMLDESENSDVARTAAFDARIAKAAAQRKAIEDMEALASGSNEPTPSDYMMLHDPVVSPDLRAGIIEARKRMWMMSRDGRMAYREVIFPLVNAIQNLIDTHGVKFTPLMRMVSPSMAGRASDGQPTAKLAKADMASRVASDLNYLIDPRLSPALRRRLIEAKKELDRAGRDQRSNVRKAIHASGLLEHVRTLKGAIGQEGVDALHRVLVN